MKSSVLSAVALASLLPLATLAAEPTPATPRLEFSFNGSVTDQGDTDYAGLSNGAVETATARASARFRDRITDTLRYTLGLNFAHVAIDTTASVPLPEKLQAEFAELGVAWSFADNWTLMASAQPGLYGDGEASSSDAFDAPALLIAQWQSGGAWTIGAGVRYSSLARNSVIPLAYFHWRPNDQWAVAFGAPRTEVAYQFDRDTSFFAGGSFEGGAFAIDDPAITPPAGYPSLRETKLDYREIRVGVGVRQQLSPTIRFQFEGGAAVDRRFEYFDRALKIEADPAAFFALSLVATY